MSIVEKERIGRELDAQAEELAEALNMLRVGRTVLVEQLGDTYDALQVLRSTHRTLARALDHLQATANQLANAL